MYSCGPEWERNLISTDRLENILAELAGHIIPSPRGADSISLNHGLHLTGGEPFLFYDKLLEATKVADEIGIPSLFVETNSFWSRDKDLVRKRLEELKKAGLDGITISVNPFYLEYIPIENTKRNVRISREVFGEDVMVYQAEYLRKFERSGIEGTLDLEDYLESQGGFKGEDVEFFLSGRAPYEVPKYDQKGMTPHPPEWWLDRSCRPPFLREWHNHVDSYGNYIPGYCGGLSFGKIRDLDMLITAGRNPDEYPILSLISRDDFRGLYHLARDYDYEVDSTGYYSKCHLCLDIRSYLHREGNFAELKPDEFYRQLPTKY